jgi:hypothetical protein
MEVKGEVPSMKRKRKKERLKKSRRRKRRKRRNLSPTRTGRSQ